MIKKLAPLTVSALVVSSAAHLIAVLAILAAKPDLTR